MDEGAHPLGRPQPVVELDRLPGLPDVRGDAPVLEHPQRLRAHAEPLVEALREHHRGRAALEQLLDVGRLDARVVAGAGLVPVPGSRAAGEELGVLEGAAIDLQASQERWVTIGELACSSIVAPRASCCGQDQVSTPDLSRG